MLLVAEFWATKYRPHARGNTRSAENWADVSRCKCIAHMREDDGMVKDGICAAVRYRPHARGNTSSFCISKIWICKFRQVSPARAREYVDGWGPVFGPHRTARTRERMPEDAGPWRS